MISPVLYAYRESAIINTIRRMWFDVVRYLEKSGRQQDVDDHVNSFYDCIPYVGETMNRTELVDDPVNKLNDIYGVCCFTKPYEGRRWIRKEERYSKESVSFYDEREWRFVPMHEDHFEYGLPKKQFLDGTGQSYINQELEELSGLHFELSDIKYIIVSNDDEIVSIITEIEKNMGEYSQDDIKLLSSKVISTKQIDEDF